MVAIRQDDNTLTLRFGGGIHTSASEDEINDREAADGQNFALELENRFLRNRAPFDLLGTAPNAGSIRGLINLLKSDGSTAMAVQAGNTVYSWDGTNFSSIGTVSVASRLRGRLEHNFQIDEKVLITDLSLIEPVLQWDGATFEALPTNLGSSFKSRYCVVENERAMFANVESNATATPHLLVASKRSDASVISVSDRPSSSLGLDDPFFIPISDLRAINGLELAFGKIVMSTQKGSIFELLGSDATDFSLVPLYPRSAASGEEALRYIGNDMMYAPAGRIESLIATEKFGDVQSDDLSIPISDSINGFDDWTIVYNQRNQRVYLFAKDVSEAWVYFKDLAKLEVSPWGRWKTTHASSFQPTAIMNMLDPVDGLEYVYFGDGVGNFYRMEGSGSTDGGTAAIRTNWLSKLFSAPGDADVYDIEGWIAYRKNVAATVTLTFEFAGHEVYDAPITITIPAIANRPVFRNGLYFRDENYFRVAFGQRLSRQPVPVDGSSSSFQVRVVSEDAIQILEIGLVFNIAA